MSFPRRVRGSGSASTAPFRIVARAPGPSWPRRAGRTVVFVLGVLIFLAGLLLAVPTLLLLIVLPLATFAGDGTSPGDWLWLAGLGPGAILLLFLGLRLVRARRYLVVFLRRFGFNDASAALTFAVGGALGRRWRLVTLDDSRIEAVGVGRGTRLTWGAGQWLSLLALAIVVALVLRWWFGGGPEGIVGGIWDGLYTGAEENGSNPLEAAFVAFIGTLVVGLVVLSLIVGLLAAAISALGVASLASWRANRAVHRAERAKALNVDDASAVAGAVDRVLARSRGIQAPRLVVLRVADACWRDVVRALAEEADVAIVDVSDPTEHLAWEVATLQSPGVRARPLMIGRRDRVEALAAVEAAGGGAAARLREQLRGETVLVYDDILERGALRRFARALAGALERTP